MTCRSEIFSIAAIHFSARSVAVIELKALKLSAWPAGMQRFESFTAPHAMGFERRLTESSCHSSGRDFIQAADRARP